MKLNAILSDPTIHKLWDTVSLGTLFGILVGWLPHIASLVTIIWGLIRIYETKTVQKFFKRPPYDSQE